MAEAPATSAAQGWMNVGRGLSIILIASVVSYLFLVTFAVATAYNVRRLHLDILHYAVIAGSVSFLSGLYFCTNGPNKTPIPRQATGALIIGMLGVGVFYLFLGSAHVTHSHSFGKYAAVPEPFALFGIGSILIFALSHGITVWTLHSVTRTFQPTTTYKLPVVYVGTAFIFSTLLGAYVVLFAMTDQALYRLLGPPGRVVDGHQVQSFRDTIRQLRHVGFWVILAASLPVQMFFLMLVVRARRALKTVFCEVPTTSPTGL